MQGNRQLCTVSISSFNMHHYALVKCIDQLLLKITVHHVIQCIDLHRLFEDLLELRTDLRQREGNNCKAPLFADDVLIRQLRRLICKAHHQFFLLFT